MSFSKKELAEAAFDEYQKRVKFYPRWVREKKISQREADERIAKMLAIYHVLSRISDDLIARAQ